MAFSYSIKNQALLGPGIRKLFGTWTGLAGDAPGSIVISGNVPQGSVLFQKTDPLDLTYASPCRVECNFSNGFTTISIENQDNVVQGTFEITANGL